MVCVNLDPIDFHWIYKNCASEYTFFLCSADESRTGFSNEMSVNTWPLCLYFDLRKTFSLTSSDELRCCLQKWHPHTHLFQPSLPLHPAPHILSLNHTDVTAAGVLIKTSLSSVQSVYSKQMQLYVIMTTFTCRLHRGINCLHP